MGRVAKNGETLNLVFAMDDVICTPHADINASRPIANVTEFMQWLKKQGHHITIWSTRLNDLETKLKTEQWLKAHQIPYDRLLFDRPRKAIFVDETPSSCKYYTHSDDLYTVAELFEEWKDAR